MACRLFRCIILVFIAITVCTACSRGITSSGMDGAAKALVSELEKLAPDVALMTAAAIGFDEGGKKGPTDDTIKLEKRINHYIAQSSRFKLIEVRDDEIQKLVALIAKQSDLKYKEPIFIDFTNLRNIITGTIERGENQAHISARLVSLENAEVLGSAVANIPFELSSSSYTLRLLLVLLGVLSLVGFAKKTFFRGKKVIRAKDFKETTCSACGRKIADRYQQGGTCTEPTCDNPICTDCWNIKRIRKCLTHQKSTT